MGRGWDPGAGTRTRALGTRLRVGAGGFCGKVTAEPTGGPDGEAVLQQALEGTFLVGLVGDVRQVDPAEAGSVVQDDITHLEGEDVALEVLLQV